MPLCTGASHVTDMWVCPYCPPKSKAESCHQLVETEEGTYKVPCSASSCMLVGFKTHDCEVFWQHVRENHGFPEQEPAFNQAYEFLVRQSCSAVKTNKVSLVSYPDRRSSPTSSKQKKRKKK